MVMSTPIGNLKMPTARRNPSADGAEPVVLPGMGMALNRNDYPGDPKPFPHAHQNWRSKGVALREIRMLDLIAQITDKPNWEEKVFNEEIVSKWRQEAYNAPDTEPHGAPHGSLQYTDKHMSENMFDYCIAELRDKVTLSRETGLVSIYDAELAIVRSDTVVSDELKQALRDAVKPLEDVPDALKDWHPGTNGTVLDLVHPSLFPLKFGLTRALRTQKVPLGDCLSYICKGETLPEIDRFVTHACGHHQWLPTEVSLTPDGAKITSYVNNLHPVRHRALYPVLERFVDAAVPLWQECLAHAGSRMRIEFMAGDEDTGNWAFDGKLYRVPGRDDDHPRAFVDPLSREESQRGSEKADDDDEAGDKKGEEKDDEEQNDEEKVDEEEKDDDDEEKDDDEAKDDDEEKDDDDDDDEWRYTDEFQDWKRENRVPVWPEPDPYKPPKREVKIDLAADYPDGLQIIFKLASVHLTPDKPEYEGGSWHVEGASNDHICATALYYYDSDNITPSSLAFAQLMDTEEIALYCPQDENASMQLFLGAWAGESGMQQFGRSSTPEGRMLVFPNAFMHQVQPFRLADPTRPGHRKSLAMFLVDPGRPIISTANVPPQQRSWWGDYIQTNGLMHSRAGARLPPELENEVIGMVSDYPLSWEQALEIRDDFMEERTMISEEFEGVFEEEQFNYCEH